MVQGENVAFCVHPAVIGNDGAHGIDALGEIIKPCGKIALRFVNENVAHAPALVEYHPSDERGMIVVLPDDIQPFARNLAGSRIQTPMIGGKLAPDDESQDVRIIEETFVLHFLMLSDAVKTHLFGKTDILYHRLFIGRSDARIGPVALIEKQTSIKRDIV